MKKPIWMLLMILTIIFAFSTNGYSQTILSVTINPYVHPNYTSSTTGGTFYALVTVSNNSLNSLASFTLYGEGFLSFNSANPTHNSPLPLPTGWNSLVVSIASGQGLRLYGPALAPGASLSFYMNYTFASNTSALNAPWSSGSQWGMLGEAEVYYYVGGKEGVIVTPPAKVIPEPGTIMLLGFGLLGSGFFARRRKKRDS